MGDIDNIEAIDPIGQARLDHARHKYVFSTIRRHQDAIIQDPDS